MIRTINCKRGKRRSNPVTYEAEGRRKKEEGRLKEQAEKARNKARNTRLVHTSFIILQLTPSPSSNCDHNF
jgi:hypothetical protein